MFPLKVVGENHVFAIAGKKIAKVKNDVPIENQQNLKNCLEVLFVSFEWRLAAIWAQKHVLEILLTILSLSSIGTPPVHKTRNPCAKSVHMHLHETHFKDVSVWCHG